MGIGVDVGNGTGVDVGNGDGIGVGTADCTFTLADALLFGVDGSKSEELTLAVLCIVPDTVEAMDATMVTLADPPLAMEPRLHVVPEQLPWLAVTDDALKSLGRESVTVVFVLAVGPALDTAMVYVTELPAIMLDTLALLVTLRSARAFMAVVWVAVLFAPLGSETDDEVVAVFDIEPDAVVGTLPVIVTVALDPDVMAPREQLSLLVELSEQTP